MPPRRLLLVLLGLAGGVSAAAAAAAVVEPEPVFHWNSREGEPRYGPAAQRRLTQPGLTNASLFRAVFAASDRWPTGLVAVYLLDGRHELRRWPLRGQENVTEPLFFALPPADDPDAGRIGGRWECSATRSSGSRPTFGWELNLAGGEVTGRFDPATDFRFAHITAGTFRSNRLALTVSYNADVFVLEGAGREGVMQGRWRQQEGGEDGTWEARRDPGLPGLRASGPVLPLHAWLDGRGAGSVRYGVEAPGPGWVRQGRAICRVWR